MPEPEPVSPFQHLDERKAAIYENLRDLQFEYRVGKLSDDDYQSTKKDLQKELARVLAEVDKLKNGAWAAGRARQAVAPKCPAAWYVPPAAPNSPGAEILRRVRQADEGGPGMKQMVRSTTLPTGRLGPAPSEPRPSGSGVRVRSYLLFCPRFRRCHRHGRNRTTGQPATAVTVGFYKFGPGGMERVDQAKTDAQGRFSIDREPDGQGPSMLRVEIDGVTYNHILPPGTPATGSRYRCTARPPGPARPRSGST